MYSTITMKYVAYKKGPLAHQGPNSQKKQQFEKTKTKCVHNKTGCERNHNASQCPSVEWVFPREQKLERNRERKGHASYEPQHPAVSGAEHKCVGVSHTDAPLHLLQ